MGRVGRAVRGAPSVHEDAVEEGQAGDPGAGEHLGALQLHHELVALEGEAVRLGEDAAAEGGQELAPSEEGHDGEAEDDRVEARLEQARLEVEPLRDAPDGRGPPREHLRRAAAA